MVPACANMWCRSWPAIPASWRLLRQPPGALTQATALACLPRCGVRQRRHAALPGTAAAAGVGAAADSGSGRPRNGAGLSAGLRRRRDRRGAQWHAQRRPLRRWGPLLSALGPAWQVCMLQRLTRHVQGHRPFLSCQGCCWCRQDRITFYVVFWALCSCMPVPSHAGWLGFR